ncbi:MAG: hydrogen peroxide-inducible genes activator [Candidatus Thiodiazotropha taylori]
MKLLPSMKQLEYLVALADTEHFGKASERCNVTASTLSAGIRDLEGLFGVSLAERSKRHVHMTSIGKEIALRARHLLLDAEDIMELASSNRNPMTGELKLGVIPTIGPFLLPRVITALNTQYPDLRLFLEEDLTDRLMDRLQQGDIDVALMAMPYDTRNFETMLLFEDKFLFACNQLHELSEKQAISVDDLYDQPLMLLEEGHCLRSHVLDACKLEQHQSRSKFEASSFHTLVQMVASGIGVTLLPELAIDANITDGTNIKLLPLKDLFCRKIGLVWRQSSLRKHEYEILGETILSMHPAI